MIGATPPGRIYVCLGASDMRRSFDGLAAIAQRVLELDPFCGAWFVFRNRRGDRLKLLWWDGAGYCLFYKRLESGTFPMPRLSKTVMLHRIVCDLVDALDAEREQKRKLDRQVAWLSRQHFGRKSERVPEEQLRLWLEALEEDAAAAGVELDEPEAAPEEGTPRRRPVRKPLPPWPMEKGNPGAGLLAHVLIAKYADHLPLDLAAAPRTVACQNAYAGSARCYAVLPAEPLPGGGGCCLGKKRPAGAR